MIRASRRGAEIDRKMVTTAEGSVVDTMAPISRQPPAAMHSPMRGQ